MNAKSSIRKINFESNSDADTLISSALRCLEKRFMYKAGEILNSSKNVCAYLRLQLAQEKNEVFSVLFLDNRHRLIAFEKMFHGTINEAVIYPRCIIQNALKFNAAAIIVAHNHPSGSTTPSPSDKKITQQLKTILDVIDVNLLDHIIVTHQETFSFAEKGLL